MPRKKKVSPEEIAANEEVKEEKKPATRKRTTKKKTEETPVVEEKKEEAVEEKKEEATLTPAEYVEKIKSLKETITDESLLKVMELAEQKLKKFKLLKQAEAAQITTNYISMFQKEIKIIQAGFTEYVLKTDVEHYMFQLADKTVFCCEIADYPREIPDEITDKIADHMDLFDNIYVVFTDYSKKVSDTVKKKTVEKDPVVFGSINFGKVDGQTVIGPRLYFLGDWVDEYCDLTLDEIIATFDKVENKPREKVVHTAEIPQNSDEFTKKVNEFTDQIISDSGKRFLTNA